MHRELQMKDEATNKLATHNSPTKETRLDELLKETPKFAKKTVSVVGLVVLTSIYAYLFNYGMIAYNEAYLYQITNVKLSIFNNIWEFYASDPVFLFSVLMPPLIVITLFLFGASLLTKENIKFRNFIASYFLIGIPIYIQMIWSSFTENSPNAFGYSFLIGLVVIIVSMTLLRLQSPDIAQEEKTAVYKTINKYTINMSFFLFTTAYLFSTSALLTMQLLYLKGTIDGAKVALAISTDSYLNTDKYIELKNTNDKLYLKGCNPDCLGFKKLNSEDISPIFFDKKDIIFHPQLKNSNDLESNSTR